MFYSMEDHCCKKSYLGLLVFVCFDLSVYSSTPLFLFYEHCLGQITANKMLLIVVVV